MSNSAEDELEGVVQACKELLIMSEAIARAMAFGKEKYDRPMTDRIQELGSKERAIRERIDATYRHLAKCTTLDKNYLFDADAKDEESGLPHIIHASFNLLMAYVLNVEGTE